MANSYYVVKSLNGADSQSQVAGFNRTRYSDLESAYGTLPAETKGSFFYFGQLPSAKIIHIFMKTVETSPVIAQFGPMAIETAITNGTALSITANSGSPVATDFVILYSNIYSGQVGKTLIVQVN